MSESGHGEALFTSRFFTLFAFTFTVFISLFQLLPTAPFACSQLETSLF